VFRLKLFTNKFHYQVDLSQELYAIGLSSTFSSFFKVYPTSSALARSMVLVESGARTQLASGVSAAFLLVTILFIGPLFEALPQVIT
jgi:MFS superfamily sulfate permease-like transporter